MCLVYQATVAVIKEINIMRQYETNHEQKEYWEDESAEKLFIKLFYQARKSFHEFLKEPLTKLDLQPNIKHDNLIYDYVSLSNYIRSQIRSAVISTQFNSCILS